MVYFHYVFILLTEHVTPLTLGGAQEERRKTEIHEGGAVGFSLYEEDEDGSMIRLFSHKIGATRNQPNNKLLFPVYMLMLPFFVCKAKNRFRLEII